MLPSQITICLSCSLLKSPSHHLSTLSLLKSLSVYPPPSQVTHLSTLLPSQITHLSTLSLLKSPSVYPAPFSNHHLTICLPAPFSNHSSVYPAPFSNHHLSTMFPSLIPIHIHTRLPSLLSLSPLSLSPLSHCFSLIH
jgi:hypothetical protein